MELNLFIFANSPKRIGQYSEKGKSGRENEYALRKHTKVRAVSGS